ncbi:MAG: hypothetical protein ACOZIN_19405 [Myxococcota bacterium]
MSASAAQLRDALTAFDREGRFGEADYAVLRGVLAGALRPGANSTDLLDGLAGLFFERHLLHDGRRAELLALDDEALLRAVRHRFRQVMVDESDDYQPYHALRAHVRETLAALKERRPTSANWPSSLVQRGAFSRGLVEEAVLALWAESGCRPSVVEATRELFHRYVRPVSPALEVSETHELPDALLRRLEGQRLARGILEVLSAEEKDLLRHVLADEGSVEDWAEANGRSRATAYRLLARLKSLCRLEFCSKSNRSQLDVLRALSEALER